MSLDSSAAKTEEVEGTAGSQVPLVGVDVDARVSSVTPRSCRRKVSRPDPSCVSTVPCCLRGPFSGNLFSDYS